MSTYALILAGGSGTRFWPQSRVDRPKHLLPLAGSDSLLQQAVRRVAELVGAEKVYIVTNEQQRASVLEQLPEIPPRQVLSEPFGRDTAAAIGYGCAVIAERDAEAIVAVTPSDHLIRPTSKFIETLKTAVSHVRKTEDIVVFGLSPSFPSTAYGYIERGRPLETRAGGAFEVKSFREKPDLETAQSFVDSGNFYWNSGIFVWRAARLLDGLEQHLPVTRQGLRQIVAHLKDDDFPKILRETYEGFAKISIDFAVIEKVSSGLTVIEAGYQWNDIGSWNALEKIYHKDRDGNTLLGKVLCLDVKNSAVWTDEHRLIGLIGVSDLIVVQTEDATLICPRSEVERVKQLVEELHSRGLEEYT